MMRKSIILLFLPLYVVLSTGLSLRLHYCHGELKSFAMSETENCCSKETCHVNEGKKCPGCTDEEIVIEPLQIDQLNTQTGNLKIVFPACVVSAFFLILPADEIAEVLISTPSPRPPPAAEKIYLALHRLTLYG